MVDYVGQQLGSYRLTRLLGEGGFAQVYLGEHIYLTTPAAIKILNMQLSSNDIEWFLIEARTIARLSHPNIVRVLDFGVQDKTPFLVLDYAPQGTLRQQHPKGTRVPLPTVVSYIKQAAEALQYAHDEKLIHRDVKPENMLLGKRNEVLLSDFGVALMAQSSRYQSLQNVAGTISYMAPEQIQGRPRLESDQYSLGIVAYEWLSGERPFDGSLTEVISQQLAVPPLALSGKIPAVSPAIEQVVMRALEKDPLKRFDSVRAFAAALEQASQAEVPFSDQTIIPVVARIDETPSLNRSATLLPASPAAATVPPVIVSGMPKIDTMPPLKPAVYPPPDPALPAQGTGTVLCTYSGHRTSVRSLSWSSDGTRLVSAGSDKAVHIWDAMTGNNIQLYQDESDIVRIVAWSPDGSRIATVGIEAIVRVWDVATNRLIVSYSGHNGRAVNAMVWSPKQPRIASADSDGIVHIWDATTGQRLTTYQGHAARVNTLAWSFNDDRIVSGGDDAAVQVWEAATGRNISVYGGQRAKVVSVAWSPTAVASAPGNNLLSRLQAGLRIACGREDGMVQMWDTANDLEILTYRHSAPVSIVAWSPDGKRFAFASDDKTVQVWDTITNSKLFTFYHTAPVRVLAWSPNGKYNASGGGDTTIQVWIAP